MKKSISAADLRSALMRDTNLWLAEADRVKAENRCNAFEEGMKYRSMAQALYLYGRGMGIVSAEDYPQFDTNRKVYS